MEEGGLTFVYATSHGVMKHLGVGGGVTSEVPSLLGNMHLCACDHFTRRLAPSGTRSIYIYIYSGELGFPFVCFKDYLQPVGTEKSCTAFICQRTVRVNKRTSLRFGLGK